MSTHRNHDLNAGILPPAASTPARKLPATGRRFVRPAARPQVSRELPADKLDFGLYTHSRTFIMNTRSPRCQAKPIPRTHPGDGSPRPFFPLRRIVILGCLGIAMVNPLRGQPIPAPASPPATASTAGSFPIVPHSTGLEFIDTSFENASPVWYEQATDGTILVNLLYDHERASPNRAAGHIHFLVHAKLGSKLK